MTEPKRRGRPPKAKPELIALPVACPECGQAVGHYDDCPAGMGVAPTDATRNESLLEVMIRVSDSIPRLSLSDPAVAAVITEMMGESPSQAYANRVWHGQSPDIKRAERIERVKRALAGQNLPFEGVTLP